MIIKLAYAIANVIFAFPLKDLQYMICMIINYLLGFVHTIALFFSSFISWSCNNCLFLS